MPPHGNPKEKPSEVSTLDTEDSVPSVLYDLLQKEVIALRKSSHQKDQSFKDKNDTIEVDCWSYCACLTLFSSSSQC